MNYILKVGIKVSTVCRRRKSSRSLSDLLMSLLLNLF